MTTEAATAPPDIEPIVIEMHALTMGELELFEDLYGKAFHGVEWTEAPARALVCLAVVWLRREKPETTLDDVMGKENAALTLDFGLPPRVEAVRRAIAARTMKATKETFREMNEALRDDQTPSG